jgi:putative MFS transporter
MGAAGAMARLGGLLAPSLIALFVTQSFVLTIGIFAGLLLLAAIAALFVDAETRSVSLA